MHVRGDSNISNWSCLVNNRMECDLKLFIMVSAVSVTRITVDIGRPSQEEEEVNPHRFRSQICRKMSVFTKLHGHKTIEVEFRIRVERPLLPRSR